MCEQIRYMVSAVEKGVKGRFVDLYGAQKRWKCFMFLVVDCSELSN